MFYKNQKLIYFRGFQKFRHHNIKFLFIRGHKVQNLLVNELSMMEKIPFNLKQLIKYCDVISALSKNVDIPNIVGKKKLFVHLLETHQLLQVCLQQMKEYTVMCTFHQDKSHRAN